MVLDDTLSLAVRTGLGIGIGVGPTMTTLAYRGLLAASAEYQPADDRDIHRWHPARHWLSGVVRGAKQKLCCPEFRDESPSAVSMAIMLSISMEQEKQPSAILKSVESADWMSNSEICSAVSVTSAE